MTTNKFWHELKALSNSERYAYHKDLRLIRDEWPYVLVVGYYDEENRKQREIKFTRVKTKFDSDLGAVVSARYFCAEEDLTLYVYV